MRQHLQQPQATLGPSEDLIWVRGVGTAERGLAAVPSGEIAEGRASRSDSGSSFGMATFGSLSSASTRSRGSLASVSSARSFSTTTAVSSSTPPVSQPDPPISGLGGPLSNHHPPSRNFIKAASGATQASAGTAPASMPKTAARQSLPLHHPLSAHRQTVLTKPPPGSSTARPLASDPNPAPKSSWDQIGKREYKLRPKGLADVQLQPVDTTFVTLTLPSLLQTHGRSPAQYPPLQATYQQLNYARSASASSSHSSAAMSSLAHRLPTPVLNQQDGFDFSASPSSSRRASSAFSNYPPPGATQIPRRTSLNPNTASTRRYSTATKPPQLHQIHSSASSAASSTKTTATTFSSKSHHTRNYSRTLTPPMSPVADNVASVAEEDSGYTTSPGLAANAAEPTDDDEPPAADAKARRNAHRHKSSTTSIMTVDSRESIKSNSSEESLAIEFPFLRALHPFDATNISHTSSESSAMCLSFQEADVALLHSVHPTGWGDATLLSSGQRGWIPTNYFAPYVDVRAVPLLSAALEFVVSPKWFQLENSSQTFSQNAITNIVSGVRSMLDQCGALTRDKPIVRSSQTVRKYRKILLAELAILVSLAKQFRNSSDDLVIEKLVVCCYKIVNRAVLFLDVCMATEKLDKLERSSDKAASARASYSSKASSIDNTTTHSEASLSPRKQGTASNRESVVFYQSPPFARARLNEVNDALTTYLGVFIHRMTLLETDATACQQILVNTRKSALACREMLAAVEAISAQSLPRSRELENSKDHLFAQIKALVAAARDVVAESDAVDDFSDTTPNAEANVIREQASVRLVDIATDCSRTAGECVVRCRNILGRIGDFQLPATREYPDFSYGSIAISKNNTVSTHESENESSEAAGNEPEDYPKPLDSPTKRHRAMLPHIPNLSPIEVSEKNNEFFDKSTSPLTPAEKQISFDDEHKHIKGASVEACMRYLTSGKPDHIVLISFLLHLPQFTTAERVIEILADRCTSEENQEVASLAYHFVMTWMESYWYVSDNDQLEALVVLSSAFSIVDPQAPQKIEELTTKLRERPANKQLVERPISGSQNSRRPTPAPQAPTITKNQLNLLARSNEQNGYTNAKDGHADTEKSRMSTSSPWTRMVRINSSTMSMSETNGMATIVDFDPSEIAVQLALMSSDMYCQIQPWELINQNFSMKRRSLNLSPHVLAMSTFSNELASFVGHSILSGDLANKARKNILKQWIKVAEKSKGLRNFNGVFAIVLALQSVNIVRLKKIWELLSPRYHELFEELKAVVVPSKNFLVYRNMLKDQNPSRQPCVPYLGTYLTDLTFIGEGNPTHRTITVDGEQVKVINFDRYERETRLVLEVEKFQKPYSWLTPSPEMQTWLRGEMSKTHAMVTKDSNSLWRRSCLVEPKA